MADYWGDLMDWLSANQADPVTYLFVFFLFCVLAAIILPIPIEVALVVDPSVPFILKALVMGLGKGTGALAVFFIGLKVEKTVLKFAKWGWFRWLLEKSERFVRRYGYVALYLIMSIPGMVDTIPLYVFSILNKEGELLGWRGFTIVNILAGITRAFLIYTIDIVFGLGMFGG